ncbi:MAG TPA: FAD-binding oxidoreductase [Vicinamibacteria bacterium]|nr:FAD-binding oxidoreductase [Vicinamibacteria bacterium]
MRSDLQVDRKSAEARRSSNKNPPLLTHEPFWRTDYPRPNDLPVASELPERVDVAVVGSGYTGLNAARVLGRSGASVSVLERETIGWGASSRNGGMATTGLKRSTQAIFETYGSKRGHEFWRASLQAIDLLEEIVRSESIDCDWRRTGHICLAYKPSHFEGMRKSVGWFRDELGHEVKALSPADLPSEIGSRVFHGGILDEYSGGLQPAKYVYGLARVVARLGVRLHERVVISRVARRPEGFEIDTNQGVLRAGEVLIATNGYTDELVLALKRRIFPVGSYIIVTEPLARDVQSELVPKGRMLYDSKNFLNYFRLTPDGRMLWGGRNDLSTDLDLDRSAEILRCQLVHAFPQLRDVPLTHSWTGKLGITFDLMPHIGRVEGIHYAMGYGGHGLAVATYLGTEVGKLLAGQITTSPFAEISHPTRFFYRGEPWFIPLAARYYRFADWIS